MTRDYTKNSLLTGSKLKTLAVLTAEPNREFSAPEVRKVAGLSKMSAYLALSGLARIGLAEVTRRGRFLTYCVKRDDPAIRCFKALGNVLLLRRVVEELKSLSYKIVLYGSAGRGEDDLKSDLDLFVLARDSEAAHAVLSSSRVGRKLQAVVFTPSEFEERREKDKLFFSEVDRGIVLWEAKE